MKQHTDYCKKLQTAVEATFVISCDCPDDGRLPDRECFWLIERKVSPPQYITEGDDLSSDPWRARRFATERAAHDHWRMLRSWRDECAVIEHMFINKAS